MADPPTEPRPLAYYGLWEKHRILYGGLVELIVNAMTDVRPGFIQWEWR
jgi:hypothetical protein